MPRTNERIKLYKNLILHKFFLEKFGKKSISEFSQLLSSPDFEGYDDNGQSRYFQELTSQLALFPAFTEDLKKYDANITKHTKAINSRRTLPIRWKYFQYLALLFTEMYLDNVFSRKELFLHELNNFKFRQESDNKIQIKTVPQFTEDDLRMIAFWQATGSGKTLLMHVHVHQILSYIDKVGKRSAYNKLLLITLKEGLSRQHRDEFIKSGFNADIFDKQKQTLFGSGSKNAIEIIEITKLKDVEGDTTVAVDSFGNNNIVFIDEGHRGAGGEEEIERRRQLTEKGFAFEYSATYGQAIKYETKKVRDLFSEYTKSILFDYSYKYFYQDGYGKEYEILNLKETNESESQFNYLCASLLCFYQQMKVYNQKQDELKPYFVHKPLLVFVGGSVTETTSTKEVTDVMEILRFFRDFIHNPEKTKKSIKKILNGNAGLENAKGTDLFFRKLQYLRDLFGEDIENLHQDLLLNIFHTKSTEKEIHLINLKGIKGEIGIRLGDEVYFGVINVGNDSKLLEKCKEDGFNTASYEFGSSLFNEINKEESQINVLVGSRKFTEGWDSWRVSSMGLMNIGRSEGSQIIQLFGRGIRLKGYKFSLQRSNSLNRLIKPAQIPSDLHLIETLHVFGIKADYMEKFREILEEEGVPTDEIETIEIPIEKTFPHENISHLKTIVFEKDTPIYKKSREKIVVDKFIPVSLGKLIEIDLYSKIETLSSKENSDVVHEKNVVQIPSICFAFLNWETIRFDLIDHKYDQNMPNLIIPDSHILKEILAKHSWYRIFAPIGALEINSIQKVTFIEREVVIPLLKKYIDEIYYSNKEKYESNHRVYESLTVSDSWLPKSYIIEVNSNEDELIQNLREIEEQRKQIYSHSDNLNVFIIDNHLYKPLIFANESMKLRIKIKPQELNKGEYDFIKSIKKFLKDNKQNIDGEIYILRNQPQKSTGVGFFEASNFYPDFIIWQVNGERQRILFCDPKGIRYLKGLDDEKIQLYQRIKEVQKKLNDENIELESYILAKSDYLLMNWWGSKISDREFENNHILFLDKEGWEKKLFQTK